MKLIVKYILMPLVILCLAECTGVSVVRVLQIGWQLSEKYKLVAENDEAEKSSENVFEPTLKLNAYAISYFQLTIYSTEVSLSHSYFNDGYQCSFYPSVLSPPPDRTAS